MEKLIARWCDWLGIACLVIAVIWKIVSVFWFWHSSASTVGAPTVAAVAGPSMFLHGSICFLLRALPHWVTLGSIPRSLKHGY